MTKTKEQWAKQLREWATTPETERVDDTPYDGPLAQEMLEIADLLDPPPPPPPEPEEFDDGMPRYPDIEVQLTGQDGNAGAIMARVNEAFKAHGVSREEQDAFRMECFAGSYSDLLNTVQRWVSVS